MFKKEKFGIIQNNGLITQGQMKTSIVIIAIIAALGTVGIISAISSATDAYAVSCKNEPGPRCHGCSSFSRGAFESDFKCRHFT
jgi:hypothetical protein